MSLKKAPNLNSLINDYGALSSAQLLALLAEKDTQLTQFERQLRNVQDTLESTQDNLLLFDRDRQG
jgi:pyridoxal/pyridoxine/pyridoxamine kinase